MTESMRFGGLTKRVALELLGIRDSRRLNNNQPLRGFGEIAPATIFHFGIPLVWKSFSYYHAEGSNKSYEEKLFVSLGATIADLAKLSLLAHAPELGAAVYLGSLAVTSLVSGFVAERKNK